VIGWARRALPALWFNLRWYVLGPPLEPAETGLHGYEPQARNVQPFLQHVHRWDLCRWNGQYWYARCVSAEWCTARRAC
jgi:hypothetical protein